MGQVHVEFDTCRSFKKARIPYIKEPSKRGMRKDEKIVLLWDACRRDPTGFERLLEGMRKELEMSKGGKRL